ncbi:MAG: NAD-dependent epimerase/dehydratase family protein [Bacteroidota bacterium]
MNKPTVFITGATGFLGAHLSCLLLKQGYRVFALRRNPQSEGLFPHIHQFHQLPNAFQPQWVTGNILDIDDLCDATLEVDAVFHCAAKVSFERKDKDALMQNNVIGTRNVVNACLKNNIPKLVYASSVAAIGRTENEALITENTDWVESKYNSQYAISKNLAEQEVWRGSEEGLQVTMVNPGIILGYGDGTSGSNQLYHMIRKGMPFYPIGSNGFVGVEDVAKLMLHIYENNLWSNRYLCVAENLKYQQLFNQLSDAMGAKQPHIALRGTTLYLATFFSKLLETLKLPSPIPSDSITSSFQNSVYHTLHADQLQGFQYTPVRAVNYYALLALGLLNKDAINQNN